VCDERAPQPGSLGSFRQMVEHMAVPDAPAFARDAGQREERFEGGKDGLEDLAGPGDRRTPPRCAPRAGGRRKESPRGPRPPSPFGTRACSERSFPPRTGSPASRRPGRSWRHCRAS
jgi:hypothetical protein